MAIMKHEDFIKTASWDAEEGYFDEQYGKVVNADIIAFDPNNAESIGVKIGDNVYSIESIQAVLEDAKRFKEAMEVFSTKTEYSITYTIDGEQKTVNITASISADALSQFYADHSYDEILFMKNNSTGEAVI